MASTSRSGNREMSQEIARELFDRGGALIILNFPVGSIFGIDMKVNQVGEKFCGIKMIPPGLHFMYYSAVSKDGCTAPRTGFFHYFASKEIVIKTWNPITEELNNVDRPYENEQVDQDNLMSLDKNLGAYPYDNLKQWTRLTCNLTESLVKKLQPLSGYVNSVTQLIPLVYPPQEDKEVNCEPSKRSYQSLEDKYLPEMKAVPETEIRFSEIPKCKYPDGSTAAQMTLHNMDSTFQLEQLLTLYDNSDELLGELQMAHVCFLIAHVYDAFEHWKKLVEIFCFVDQGLEKYAELLKTFIIILHYQIKEIPTDFFVDITGDNNFLVSTLRVFFENVKCSNTSTSFKTFIEKLKKSLTSTYRWDFESVPDDDLPVIVDE